MRQVYLLIILLSPILCFGQVIENDISVKTYAVPDSLYKNPANSDVSFPISNATKNPSFNQSPKSMSEFDSLTYQVPINLANNYVPPGTAVIPLWKNAQFVATGDIRDFPGLMQIHSGTIGINQNLGHFSIYAGAIANKYGYYNGLNTQYGITGNIQYRFNPRLSLTAFGTYYFGKPNGFPMVPAMVGYFRESTFGGYMSYQFNNTFGVDVGAQAVQQFGTNKYNFEPIVTPTVKVGKVKIGLPVGQIINGIIRSHTEPRNSRK